MRPASRLTNLFVVNGGRCWSTSGRSTSRLDGLAASAVGVSLRLLAIALPGVLVLATTDPMDLADALVQRWHVPARFAYGALAALRLLPLLSADWQQVARARRARGLDPGRSPVAARAAFAAQVLAVLVAAVRRGVRLATAMEARGFGATGVHRTIARPQPMLARDWWLIAGRRSRSSGRHGGVGRRRRLAPAVRLTRRVVSAAGTGVPPRGPLPTWLSSRGPRP